MSSSECFLEVSRNNLNVLVDNSLHADMSARNVVICYFSDSSQENQRLFRNLLKRSAIVLLGTASFGPNAMIRTSKQCNRPSLTFRRNLIATPQTIVLFPVSRFFLVRLSPIATYSWIKALRRGLEEKDKLSPPFKTKVPLLTKARIEQLRGRGCGRGPKGGGLMGRRLRCGGHKKEA